MSKTLQQCIEALKADATLLERSDRWLAEHFKSIKASHVTWNKAKKELEDE